MPFSTVSNEGFQNFVAGLKPGYVLPSRPKFDGLLKSKYVAAMESLANNTKKQKFLHYTTDLWKSVCLCAYVLCL
jgi:hypothetical protein